MQIKFMVTQNDFDKSKWKKKKTETNQQPKQPVFLTACS